MLENNAIKFAFLISLAGHCFLLAGRGFALPAAVPFEHPRELKVELEIKKEALLPKVEILGPVKKFKPVEEKRATQPAERLKELPHETERAVRAEALSRREQTQEKIDTSRRDEELMLRYQDMVKQRIESSRMYPLWARKHGIEGVTRIFFTVLPKGEARGISIIASSGSKILDEESVATVRRASPFSPVPAGLGSGHVSIEVSLVFSLSEREK
jgi:protein TonB